MLKITVNNIYSTQVERTTEGLLLNQLPFEADIVRIQENRFHIIYENKSYEAEVVEVNYTDKAFTLKMNGGLFKIKLKDRFDQLLEQLGMSNGNVGQVKDLKAPMPGLILQIAVSEGQEVKKGDPVLILEAMKMENVIKAPADAVIKALKVRKGDSVEKNQVLVLF